jgi:hypothetical protein
MWLSCPFPQQYRQALGANLENGGKNLMIDRLRFFSIDAHNAMIGSKLSFRLIVENLSLECRARSCG